MAAERLPLRKTKEILRLKFQAGLSQRAIARSVNVSQSTVNDYVGRAKVAKLAWPLPPELDDDEALDRLLFPADGHPVARRPEPDWAWVNRELKLGAITENRGKTIALSTPSGCPENRPDSRGVPGQFSSESGSLLGS
jgi:hypothetical protein